MIISLHETCFEYFQRRLIEGWKCIKLEGYNATFLSPEGIKRELDLRSDIETLRPSAAGDATGITFQIPDSTFHFDKVDEIEYDSDTTYVRSFSKKGPFDEYDLYNLADSNVGIGIINKVNIFAVCIGSQGMGTAGSLKIKVKTHATEYAYDKGQVHDSVWTSYSQELNANPNTTVGWTWNEIDALQVGPNHYYETNAEIFTTQVYIEVDYTYGSLKTEIKSEATASDAEIAAVGGKRSLTIRNHLIQTQTVANLIAKTYLNEYKDQKTKLVVTKPNPAPYTIGDTIKREGATIPYAAAASVVISYAAAVDGLYYYNLAERDMLIRKLNINFSAGNYVSVIELED